MPRIPIVNPETQGAYPAHTQFPGFSREDATTDAFQSAAALATKVSTVFAHQAGKIDRADRMATLADMKNKWDLAIKSRALTIEEEPDLDKRLTQFAKDADWFYTDILKTSKDREVRQAFQQYVGGQLPEYMVNVQKSILATKADRSIATADRRSETLAQQAAETMDPGKRLSIVSEHLYMWEELERDGHVKSTDVVKKTSAFKTKVAEKQMGSLVKTAEGRTTMRELDRMGEFDSVDVNTRLKWYETARIEDEKEQARTDRAFKKAQDFIELTWASLANYGQLPAEDLATAAKGEHPFITADKARQLLDINEKAPFAQDNTVKTQVAAIMQTYRLGPSSVGRINKARAELIHLSNQTDRPSEWISKAADELQTDERSMQGLDYARINAGIKQAEDEYKTKAPPVLPFRGIGQMQRNQQAADLAEIRNKIRAGSDPVKAVEGVMNKRSLEQESMPEKDKKLYEVLDGLR